jgi:hypothetical protein
MSINLPTYFNILGMHIGYKHKELNPSLQH